MWTNENIALIVLVVLFAVFFGLIAVSPRREVSSGPSDDPGAIFNKGRAYILGEGVEQDVSLGYEFVEKAADLGQVDAEYAMGMAYLNGYLREEDAFKAYDFFLKAAEKEHLEAMYQVALCQIQGRGVYTNMKQSFETFMKAAKLGHAPSMTSIARFFKGGIGVDKDYAEAVQWLKKAIKKKDKNARLEYGNILLEGYEGVEADYDSAFKLFLSIEKEVPGALEALAVCYENGYGVEQNLDVAFQYYEAGLGYKFPNVYYKMSKIYGGKDEIYNFVNRNETLSEELLLKAAEFGSSEAAYDVFEKMDTPGNEEAANEWLFKAARGGDVKSQLMVARYSLLGLHQFEKSDLMAKRMASLASKEIQSYSGIHPLSDELIEIYDLIEQLDEETFDLQVEENAKKDEETTEESIPTPTEETPTEETPTEKDE